MKQLALDLAPPPPTLDNFVAGRNAELLHQLARLAAGERSEHFYYLWGAPGSGRSHLLRSVVAVVRANGADAGYIACDSETRFTEDPASVGCIAVDDVDRLGDDGQRGLFSLCNSLRERRAVLLASGDGPPAQLKLRQDLVTRLGWGLVYEVHALSDQEKAQALKRHAAGRGFDLADEVCAYLLTRGRRDMPALLAMLDALDRHSLELKRPITVPLVRELMRATPSPLDAGNEPPPQPSPLEKGEG